MATVIAEMLVSLDGFVANHSDEVGPLFDWYGNGDVEVPSAYPKRWTFRTSEASSRYLRDSMERVAAFVIGQRLPSWVANGKRSESSDTVVAGSVPPTPGV